MSETLSVTLDTSKENVQPTLEEEAAKYTEAPVEGDRPEWLPEKFKSPEDLAKAYQELQSKFSSRTKQEPDDDEEYDGEEYADEAEGEELEAEDQARDAVEEAGLNFDELSSKYWDRGGLDDSDYDTLEANGIPRSIVDQFIQGQQAIIESTRQSVLSSVGGEASYNELTSWAKDNLAEDEIDAYNIAVNGGDMRMTMLAVKGLEARYRADNGAEPKRQITGETSRAGSEAYRSLTELQKDMSDPKYKTDPAFRRDVERKLSISDIM
jgi:hypothetical protein